MGFKTITVFFAVLVVLHAQQLDQFAVTTSGKMSLRNDGSISGNFISTGGLEARNGFSFDEGFVQGDVNLLNNPNGQSLDVVGSVSIRNGADIDDINTFNLDPSNTLEFESILGIVPRPQNMTFTNVTRIFNFDEVFRATSFRSLGSGPRCKTFPNDINPNTHVSGSVVYIEGDVTGRNNVELTFDENARVIINGNLELRNDASVSFGGCKGTLHIYGDLIARNDFETCGGIWVNGTTELRNNAEISGFLRSDIISARNNALFERKDLSLPTAFQPQYTVLTTQYDVPTNEFPFGVPYDMFITYPDAPSENFPLIVFLAGGTGFNRSSDYSRLAANIATQGYVVAIVSRFISFPPIPGLVNLAPCSSLDALEAFWIANPSLKPNVDLDNIIFSGHSFGGSNAIFCVSANEQGTAICNGTSSINCGTFDVTSRPNVKGVVQYGGIAAGNLNGAPPAFIPSLLPGKFGGWFRGGIDQHSGIESADNFMRGYTRYGVANNDKNLAFFIKGANHWIVTDNANPEAHQSPDLFLRIDEEKASRLLATLFHQTIEYFNNDSEEALQYFTGGFRESDELIPYDVPVVC